MNDSVLLLNFTYEPLGIVDLARAARAAAHPVVGGSPQHSTRRVGQVPRALQRGDRGTSFDKLRMTER